MKTKHNSKIVKSHLKRQHRPLHKKLLLHPVNILILLCAGVLLIGATFQSHAADLDISATVPAPLPTGPALITSPSDQSHFTDPTLTVIGTCPNDSYVKLYNNDRFSGVSQCNGGTFSIQTSLTLGANLLQAKVFNITDNEGPASSPITVYYNPPVTPQPPAQNTPSDGTPTQQEVDLPQLPPPQLAATSDYHYQTLYPGEKWSWNISIAGGAGPYKITIVWGDGTTTTLGPSGDTNYTLTHIYQAAGTYHPLITITDQSGQTVILQMLAIVKPPANSAFAAPVFPVGDIQSYLWVIWPTYTVIVLMVASFWLGEFEVTRKIAGHALRKHFIRHRGIRK